MVKKLFLILLAFTVIAGFWLLFSYVGNDDSSAPVQDELPLSSFPTSPIVEETRQPAENLPASILEGGTITLLNETGQFERLPLNITASEEEVLADDLSLLFENKQYQNYYDIAYHKDSGSITIYLHELPLSFARDVALEELVAALDVNQTELCNLNITVQTNEFVSLEYTGFDLGIPGCSGAVVLP